MSSLAFSSVAHAGYLLVGVVGWRQGGGEAVLFYLLVYGLMNLGAFAVLTSLERRGEGLVLYQLSGLSDRRPLTAAAMALFMLSLAGVPATGGFMAKFWIFKSVVEAGWIKLAVFGVLYAAIAAYYYLRVIVVMYMHPADTEQAPLPDARGTIGLLLAALAAGVLVTGLLPGRVLELVVRSWL